MEDAEDAPSSSRTTRSTALRHAAPSPTAAAAEAMQIDHLLTPQKCRRSSRRMCLIDRLASIELQSVMHFLDKKSVLTFARCSRRLHTNADTPFAWKYHRQSLLVNKSTPPDVGSLLTRSLLRHRELRVDVAADYAISTLLSLRKTTAIHLLEMPPEQLQPFSSNAAAFKLTSMWVFPAVPASFLKSFSKLRSLSVWDRYRPPSTSSIFTSLQCKRLRNLYLLSVHVSTLVEWCRRLTTDGGLGSLRGLHLYTYSGQSATANQKLAISTAFSNLHASTLTLRCFSNLLPCVPHLKNLQRLFIQTDETQPLCIEAMTSILERCEKLEHLQVTWYSGGQGAEAQQRALQPLVDRFPILQLRVQQCRIVRPRPLHSSRLATCQQLEHPASPYPPPPDPESPSKCAPGLTSA